MSDGSSSPKNGAIGVQASPASLEAAALDRAGRHMDAIAVLSAAAAEGDLGAKRTVGLRILLGDRAPPMGPEGVRLLSEAAMQGDAGSAHFSAILAGAGIYCAQDWDLALDWLQQAAELGSQEARGTLGVLCTDPDLPGRTDMAAPPPSIWSELRKNTDIAGLLSPGTARTLCNSPLIRAYADFADARVCAWLIDRARTRLSPAQVYNPEAGRIEQTQERTNSAAIFSLLHTDLVQIAIQHKIAATVGLSFGHLEPAAVLHYAPGQVFEDHYDFIEPETPSYEREIARGGQRTVTFLIYLNQGYVGGETDFPLLRLSHRGNAGEALSFVNALPDGAPDTRTLHAGRAPRSGEKWVVSQFIRDRSIVPGIRPHIP